jgi:NADPH:quinone reductase-like Zn-dependent oxidoreductase
MWHCHCKRWSRLDLEQSTHRIAHRNESRLWPGVQSRRTGEGSYLTLGASAFNHVTLQTYMIAPAAEVFPAPGHLSDEEAAVIGAAGLTAWRAVMIRSENAKPGQNILIMGIGGEVSIFTMRFALMAGCNVWVTSSKEEKLRRARETGAQGGILYTGQDLDAQLLEVLPPSRRFFDAIIDVAGGELSSGASNC